VVRIKVTFFDMAGKSFPFDYHNVLSAVIYNIINTTDSDFARWLHDHGYGEKRKYKFFNFSPVTAKPGELEVDRKSRVVIFKTDTAYMYISTPKEELAISLINSLSVIKMIKVRGEWYKIDSVTAISPPSFENSAIFKAISPIVLTRPVVDEFGNFSSPEYVRPWDEDVNHMLKKNAISKYMEYGHKIDETKVEFFVDEEYIKRKGQDNVICARRYKKEKIIGFKVPVKVKASPEFLHFIYDIGLGAKNSQGFGMIELSGWRY